jgi:transposase
VEGAPTKAVFEAYVEQVLAPRLAPGQMVILDNLAAHKSKRVIEIVEGKGCRVLFLPAYSPELSPIEEAFSPRSRRCSRRPQPGPARRSSKGSGGRWRRSPCETLRAGSLIAATRLPLNRRENR